MFDLIAFPFDDGEIVVDSRLIAQELKIEHRSFMATIITYKTKVENAFGFIRFQDADSTGGRPEKFAYLTEDQATILMTFSRNTEDVVDCKIKLVKAFSKAKELIKLGWNNRSGRGAYWYKRLGIAMSDNVKPLEAGYFCVYLEMMRFFSELEMRLGYIIDDFSLETNEHLVPDISIAKCFNGWLRSCDELASQARLKFLGSSELIDFRASRTLKDGYHPEGGHYSQIKMYNHVYPKESHGNYQTRESCSYPNEYKSIFHYYLEEYWISDRCIPYLQKRDPEGIESIKKTLSIMPIEVRNVLSATLIGKLVRSLPSS